MGTLRCECEEWTPRGGKGREELQWSPHLGTAVGVSQTRDPRPLSTVSQTKLGLVSQGSVCLSVHESRQGCTITSKYSASSILYVNSFYCILSTTRVTTNVFVRGSR